MPDGGGLSEVGGEADEGAGVGPAVHHGERGGVGGVFGSARQGRVQHPDERIEPVHAAEQGGAELVHKLEKQGYDWLRS